MMAQTTTRKRPAGFGQRRLKVLAAAARVFSEMGYERASMRRIAAEARTSLAGIYHYVSSKDELLTSIQRHSFDALLRGLQAGLAGIAEPRERLGAAIRNHVGHFGGDRASLEICFHEPADRARGDDDEIRERRRVYFEAIHRLVRDLPPRRGTPLDSRLATANLLGMLGWNHRWPDPDQPRFDLDDFSEQLTTLFLDGYAQVASRAGNGGIE
jgi:TetR/AcrR family transcriptional regulator